MIPKVAAFFAVAVSAAQASMKATGVPASVTLAQCALESGWLIDMPKGSNNPFGIKATHLADPDTYVEAMTTEYEHGKLVHEEQPFEKFPTLADAFTAHASLFVNAQRYAPAMAVKGNAAEFAQKIQDCGYSTNRPPLASKPPYYVDSLMQLIREYDLYQYDVNV